MFTKPTNCPNPECRFRRGLEGAEELYGTSRFWATTKALAGLHDHLMLYVAWQNGYKIDGR